MEQENNGTDSQITVDNTAKTSYFSAKYILVGLIADTEGRWSCFCGIVNEVFQRGYQKKTELCSRYQIAVLGNVVVDGKQEKIEVLMAFTKRV